MDSKRAFSQSIKYGRLPNLYFAHASISNLVSEFQDFPFHQEEMKEIKSCRIEKRIHEKKAGKILMRLLMRSIFPNLPEDFHMKSKDSAPRIYPNPKNLEVSLSHSGDRIIITVSPSRHGVDLERFRTVKPGVMKMVLNEDQLEHYQKLENPSHDWIELLYFTQKEAVLKAEKLGIAGGPHKVFMNLPAINQINHASYLDRKYLVLSRVYEDYLVSLCMDYEDTDEEELCSLDLLCM